jgi:SOS-response transcriptional repressor LexA
MSAPTLAPATPAIRSPLTARQAEVLAVVARHIRERGYAPTLRELCVAIGTRSTTAVTQHLDAIQRKGYLRRDAVLSRGLVVLGVPEAEGGAEARPLALDGATAGRCAALLRELLDGGLGGSPSLTAEHDRDLRALLAALSPSSPSPTTSPAPETTTR